MKPPKPLVLVASGLSLALVVITSFVHTNRAERRYLREREFSRQWESNYVSMKAAFDKLEAHCLICQTNFQALVDALAGQKTIRAK